MKIPHLSELRQDYGRSSSRVQQVVRLSFWAGVALVVWSLVGFFALPPILRSQMEKQLSTELKRTVTVEKIRINPLMFSLTLEGFKVAKITPEEGTLLSWRRLYVNFDTFSFLRREWRFQDVELDGFEGNVLVNKDGRLSFADLLARLGQKTEPSVKPKSPWPLVVLKLAITEARLNYSDISQGEVFSTDIGPTTVALRDFHTGGKGHAPGEFSATTESGETFSWSGRLSFAPLRSSGDVELGKLSLKKYAPYYAGRVRFDVLDGRLDIAGHYDFTLENGQPELRLSEGKAQLKTLRIAERGQAEPVVSIDQIEVAEVAATWPTVSADVGRVVVTGGSVNVRRTAAGIDLVSLFTPLATGTTPAPSVSLAPAEPVAPEPLPNVKVGAITLRGLAVTLEDQATPRVAKHQISDVNCDLRNLALASPATPMPFGFRANYAPEGQVHLAGTITLAPLKAELGVELTNISLASLSPYAEMFANLRVGRGRLTTALYLGAEIVPDKAPVLSAQGELNIDNFAAHDATEVDELVSWRSLSVKGLEYSNEPAKLLATEILWVEPSGHLIVNADGTTNLGQALNVGGGGEAETEPSPTVSFPKTKPTPTAGLAGDMVVALERFVLEKGSVDFTDRSVQPNVRVVLNQFSGLVEGLSSSELARASVDIRGRVDSVTPVVITGKTNPLSIDAFTELKVTLKGMELVPIGPYVGKFAGYELARGSLTLDIKYNIKKRKVDAANVVTIDQFTFGNATNSPDATKLPVRLAVALLRDTAGKIVLDVPVQGSLDDPNFRVGRVVWRVITNLLAKAATSPFALLGSMFGGGKGEELSFQSFLPGEDIPVDDEEIKKLDIVAKALMERPTLRLEIVGGYDEAVDAPVLRGQVLENQMRNIIWNDRRMVDPAVTLDQIQIDPVQRNGMTRRLFYKAFPKEKPKRLSPGDPGYTEESVTSQRGNLGAFQRKQKVVAPVPEQKKAPAAEKKPNPDGTTETTPEVKEIKALTFDEMRARLLAQITVDEETYRKLASARANAVRQYLINHGEVPAERLSLAAITSDQPAAKGARVELKLK